MAVIKQKPYLNAAQKEKAQAERDKLEIQRLRSKNLLYQNNIDRWIYYQAAYEGGCDFANKANVFRHPREHQKDYDERLKRAYYENYCEPLVDFFGDFIFKETIQRNGGDDNRWYQSFLQNVNKKGDDITSFMKDICADTQIYGMTYVLVESPKLPVLSNGKNLTKADEDKLGLRPYWVSMRPTEIYDWVSDAFDKFLYVKRMQMSVEVTASGFSRRERYTEWTTQDIRITDIDVTIPSKPVLLPTEKITNHIGMIPIEVFRYKRQKGNSFMGASFLKDLADTNRAILNTNSLEDEFEYRQCFNILVLEAEESVPFKEQEEGETGTNNAIIYPKGGKAPEYISPHPDPAKYMADRALRLQMSMFKRAAQDMVNDMFNGGRSSGHSKAMSFSTTVPRIASRADILERGEHALMRLTYAYRNQEWAGTIRYKDRYEITNITDALAQLGLLFRDLQMQSPTFVKETLKRMVHEIDGKLPPLVISAVEAEIDKMDMDEWFNTQKLSLLGRAAASPEAAMAFTAVGPEDTHDKPVSAANPTRPQSTTQEIDAESAKRPIGSAPKNAPKGK